jgi:hypothetical protein
MVVDIYNDINFKNFSVVFKVRSPNLIAVNAWDQAFLIRMVEI